MRRAASCGRTDGAHPEERVCSGIAEAGDAAIAQDAAAILANAVDLWAVLTKKYPSRLMLLPGSSQRR